MALTPDQIAMRLKGIGASEVAAIFADPNSSTGTRHPWNSQVDLFMQKKGLVPPPEENEDMRRGYYLEDGIANWTADKLGIKIKKCGTLVHPDEPVLLATPDRLIVEGKSVVGLLEIKSPRRSRNYTSPEVDPQGCPEYVAFQLQQQLGVARAIYGPQIEAGTVAALVHGEIYMYQFPFNQRLFDYMRESAVAWWQRHIEGDVPPPIDGDSGSIAYLDKLYPAHKGDEFAEADPDVEGKIFRLMEVEAALKEVEAEKKRLQNQIKDYIGHRPGIAGPWGKIHWKRSKDSTRYDTKRMIQWFEDNKLTETLDTFKTLREGTRVFKPVFKPRKG